MKFLVDAQLPRRIARQLSDAGHDAVHTLDLPAGNRMSDTEIIAVASAKIALLLRKMPTSFLPS